MGRDFTNFENNIKEALEGVELPYDSQSWNDLEKKMNRTKRLSSRNSWIFAASFVLASTAVSVYLINQSDSSEALQFSSYNEDNNVYLAEGVFKKLSNSQMDFNSNATITLEDAIQNNTGDTKKDKTVTFEEFDKIPENVAAKEKAIEILGSNLDPKDSNKKETNSNSAAGSVYTVSSQVACLGESIDFSIIEDKVNGTYLWNFGNGDFSDEPSASTTYNEPGIYKVIMTVISSADGQMRRIDNSSEIEILPSPVAKFEYELLNQYSESPQVRFVNKSIHANNSFWEVDGNLIANEISPIYTFADNDEHIIKLMVENEFGCTDTEFKYIKIENDYNLLADKSFSPNNDGRNDFFIPNSLRLMDNEFKFTVFKGNDIVFESTNADDAQEWDGTLSNGTKAQIDETYQWVVILLDDNNQEQFYGGEITIVP